MIKRMKSFTLAVVLLLSAVIATGCGRAELDAEKAVDAYLRAELQGDIDDYAKLLGRKKEDVQKEYDANVEEFVNIFGEAEMFGDSFMNELPQVIKDLLGTAKYEITGSEKDKDGNYTVDVMVYPSNAIALANEKAAQAGADMTEDDDLGEVIIERFKNAIDEQTYGAGEEYQVGINYNKEKKMYEFDEEDTKKLMEAFFVLDDLTQQLFQPTGTVYDNPYLNWTKTEWDAATEEERTQCCLAMIQEMQGLTDEQMAMVDLNDATVQQAIQQMKDGLNLSFEGGVNVSMGDYIAAIQGQMAQ